MESVTVRVLGVDQWREYRAVRLAALKDSPHAFSSGLDEELPTTSSSGVRAWCVPTGCRLSVMALRWGCVGRSDGRRGGLGRRVRTLGGQCGSQYWGGLGSGRGGLRPGVEERVGHLYYWVGSQNGRAIGFASNFGFRPTSHRRTARTPCVDCGEHQEIAMAISLPSNAGVPNPMGPRLIGQPGPAGDVVSCPRRPRRTAARRCLVEGGPGCRASRSWVEGKKSSELFRCPT